MKALLICIMTMLTVGCANVDWKQEIAGAASVKLLYEEFAEAKVKLEAINYGDEQKAAKMRDVINELDRQRIYLGHLHEQNGTQIALTVPQALTIYNGIRQSYLLGRSIYIAYLQENNLPPDRQLIQYDMTAQQAGSFIAGKISSGQSVMSGEIVDLLRLAFRMYAATKGVPLVQSLEPLVPDPSNRAIPAGAVSI